MFTIAKRFTFSASHQLDSLPDGHKCKRLHGHNYVVWLELETDELDEHGFVIDFGHLASFRMYIDLTLDHQHLNNLFVDSQPTAERVAKHLFEVAAEHWEEVTAVRVYETETSWAEFRD